MSTTQGAVAPPVTSAPVASAVLPVATSSKAAFALMRSGHTIDVTPAAPAAAPAMTAATAVIMTTFEGGYKRPHGEEKVPLTFAQFANVLEVVAAEYDEAALPLKENGKREKPSDAPGFSPASYDGCYRTKNSHDLGYALGLDVDQRNMTIEEIASKLRSTFGEVALIVYSSLNHSAERTMYRVFVGLGRPITYEEHGGLWRRAVVALEGAVDTGAKDASHFWYPRLHMKGRERAFEFRDGGGIDVDAVLAESPADTPREVDVEEGGAANDVAPRGADDKRYSRCLEKFRARCRLAPPDTSDNILSLASFGKHGYRLPLDVVRDEIARLYNPRCTEAWSDKELAHKVSEGSRWAKAFAVVDADDAEEFGKALLTGWARGRQERAVEAHQEAVRVQGEPRKRHDQAHVYSFLVGTSPMVEPVKRAQNKLLSDLAFLDEWRGVWQYDEFTKKIYAVDPPVSLEAERGELTDEDVSAVCSWFEDRGFLASDKAAKSAIKLTAKQNRYHAVVEYLDALPAAGSPGLLDTLATRIFGATLPAENEMLRKFLIAAVRRARKPGTKVDTMLLLIGEQALKKSTFVEALFGGDGQRKWFRDQMPDLDKKAADASLATRGVWGIEMGELAGMKKAEVETIRQFLSRQEDRFRAPYDPGERDQPRQCVFVGTSNDEECLSFDPAGYRRFWPILVRQEVDLDWLRAHRDAIWAEANRLAATTEQHWYDRHEEHKLGRERFIVEDEWTDAIDKAIRDQITTMFHEPRTVLHLGKRRRYLKISDVYTDYIKVRKGKEDEDRGSIETLTTPISKRIGVILKKRLCEKAEPAGFGRVWLLPQSDEQIDLDTVKHERKAAEEASKSKARAS
jgi:hypothetical protein